MDSLNTDAMIVGMMSASFITFWLQTIDSFSKAATGVLFSAFVSGVAAPIASIYLIAKFPSLAQSSDGLQLLSAIVIGFVIPWGVPIFINFFKTKYGGKDA